MPRNSILSAAVLAASIATAGSAGAQGTVKIGMVIPMTGALAGAGQQVLAGARLYIKQHGEIVAGKRIELIVRDGASSGETGQRLIQELVVNDQVDVIGGSLTADLMPSASFVTKAQKPTVIMISSTTAVIDKSPFFVRTSCTLAMIREWLRVLKPGGHMALELPCFDKVVKYIRENDVLDDRMVRWPPFGQPETHKDGEAAVHKYCWTRAEFKKMLEYAGCVNVSEEVPHYHVPQRDMRWVCRK